MTEQKYQPPIPIRNLDKGVFQQAKTAAKKIKQNVGVWISQAIKERLNREGRE